MPTVEKFSPCKVNLMLAILGPRPDGFHELLSLVAPTKFGDTLIAETAAGKTCDSLECNMEGVPTDSSNLVIKAAELFRQKTGLKTFFNFLDFIGGFLSYEILDSLRICFSYKRAE